jgi:hypothetical protein
VKQRIPTADQAQPILTRLAQLTTATLKPATKTRPAEIDHGPAGYIRARIAYHLDLARTHPSRPDGYPTHTPGANPSNGRTPTGPDTDVQLTSVEAAVEALARHKDRHDDLTANAYQHIAQAVYHAAAGEQILRHLDNLATLDNTLGLQDERWCVNPAHGTSLEPRAQDGGRYCRPCADINRRLGNYPNATLIDHMARNGRRLPSDIIRLQFPDWKPDTVTA